MNIEPNKETDRERMMAYLYNELSSAEKIAYEQELAHNEALKAEVASVQATRNMLKAVKNKAVNTPPFLQLMQEEKRSSGNSAFKWVGSIAAGLLLLLFAAKLSGLNVATNEKGTSIAFNNSNVDQQDYIPKLKVDSMIAQSLLTYDQKLKKQLINRAIKQETALNKQFEANRDLMQVTLNDIQQDNAQMLAGYWQKSNVQQQQYMNTLMTDFTTYVEGRRNEDMQYLMAKINLLETDNDLLELEATQLKNAFALNKEESVY